MAGRPPKFTSAEELQAKIEEYFDHGVKKRLMVVGRGENSQTVEVAIPTITGLVLYLGFCDRASFYDQEKVPAFSHTIKRARTLIEQVYEEQLSVSGGAGPIFALKNFGWHDKQILEQTGPDGGPLQISHTVTDSMKELLCEVYDSEDGE